MSTPPPGKESTLAAGASDLTIFVVGIVMIAVLVPLVIGAATYEWTAFAAAALLLAAGLLVKPGGRARVLRWVPIGFGVYALVGAILQFV